MTHREAVLARHPDALARLVQRVAHSVEAYEREIHWEVRARQGEDALLLATALAEEFAWAEAARACGTDSPTGGLR
jgi:hypothetical protein